MQPVFRPNFFILGAAKCGTTTLWGYLRDMPDICMSRPKEPLFFEAQYEKGLGFYRKEYFAHWKGEKVIGEARHRNLYLPFIPRRIHAVNPDAKLLVILRDPVERAHSHWYHFFTRGKEPMGFADALRSDLERLESGLPEESEAEARRYGEDVLKEMGHAPGIYRTYLDTGHYMEQIDRYLALFPREAAKVVLFEDLAVKPLRVVTEVVRHLGLDEETNRAEDAIWLNVSVGEGELPPNARARRPPKIVRKAMRAVGLGRWAAPRSPPKAGEIKSGRPAIDPATRDWLRRYYAPHNRRLGEFLGRDLSHWD